MSRRRAGGYTARMRQVQVRGCLPALLVMVVLGALVALVIFASLAVALPVAGALLLLGLARALWYRMTGRRPAPGPVIFRTIRVDTGWSGAGPPGSPGEEGPVVDALPRAPRGGPEGATAGPGPERLPGPHGTDGSER